MSVERKAPLASPHASSVTRASDGLRAPTSDGSRRAQPGYSTGGVGGCTVPDETSSTALSSAPLSGSAAVSAEEAGASEGASVTGGVAGAGCGATTCCASAGRAKRAADDAMSNGLVRIAPLSDRNLNAVSRLLLRQARKE